MTLNFTVRLLGFCVSTWLMLDYIVACKVSTKTAAVMSLLSIILVVMIFIGIGRHKRKVCSLCRR